MRNKFNLVALLFLFIIMISIEANSGTTGKIAGLITDEQSGNPLPGASVVIEGTVMGAAADANGYYFIINVPPGKYRLKAIMMGYKSLIKTDVQVIIDLTTTVDFALTQTVIEGEVVEVIAERPLIETDVTSSSVVTTGEQIDKMPVNTFQEVLVTTPGFVESGTGLSRELNVRGGRTNEMAYLIDGFYVEDPLMGGMGSDVANVGIAELAVMTGTFNAEYGEAMSGVLNIVTKEGGNSYTGRARFLTDRYINHHKYQYLYKYLNENGQWVTKDGQLVSEAGTAKAIPGQNKYNPNYWEKRTKSVTDFGIYRTDLYIGGPIPLFSQGNSFYLSGDALDTRTYLGWTGQPYRKDRRANAKLVLRPINAIKLTLGAVAGRSKYKNYSHGNKYVPQNTGTNFDDNFLLNGTMTHSVSPSTFYEIKSSVFLSNRHYYKYQAKDFFSGQDQNGEWQILDPDSLLPDGSVNPNYGQYTGMANISPPDEEYEFDRMFFDSEDSVWTAGGGATWEERKNIISTGKFVLTSQINKVHQFKLGFEVKQLDLKYHYVLGPYTSAPDVEKYKHKPIEGSAYFQDKMEFDQWGLVVNAGLRLDYMNTKAKYVFDPHKPTAEMVIDPLTGKLRHNLVDAEKKAYLSPRLGFSHFILEKATLHFAYGHFYQIPQYNYLYYFENMDDPNYPAPNMQIWGEYTWLGNANLKPEKTVAYELGIETQLAQDMSLDVTLYFKNIYDYIALKRYQAIPVQYHRYVNMDYANAKGVEITLKKRFTHFFGGQINYTLSKAEGNAADVTSHYNDWYSFSVYNTYPPKKMITMDWDQTHTVNFVLDIGKSGNWGVNIVGTYGSGLPYTPLSSRGLRLDEPNSARMPWTMNVDLRAQKIFNWFGKNTALFLNLDNVLNKKNVLAVYGSTGRPDATVDWDDTQDFVKRPHYYSAPRTIELGLSVGF